jgi:preprotein translocase subunit YajC
VHTSLTLLNHALNAATSSGSKKGGSSFLPFVLLIGLFGVAYFIFLRPARNRQRAAVQARRQVEVGDEVTTTSGLIANVVAVDDEMLTLEIAPGVHCRYLPAAVLRVNGLDDAEPDEDLAEPTSDASSHEVIDQPTTTVDQPTTTVDEPPTVVEEPTIKPTDSTNGTTETPDDTPPR